MPAKRACLQPTAAHVLSILKRKYPPYPDGNLCYEVLKLLIAVSHRSGENFTDRIEGNYITEAWL
jgi:hypothetical protein